MQQSNKKQRRQINGWMNIDKPAGMTSAQVVGKIKFLTKAAKVGHAGTLDPMATGILPIAFGSATKTIPYLQEQKKSYRFTVKWGAETTTDDREGETVKTSDMRPSLADINALLPKYTGRIEQVPCTFSAIKVDGARAYDLARAGETVELKSRSIDIYQFRLLGQLSGDLAEFEVVCGTGAYMRALARDLGRDMGCFGHLTAIRRLSVGSFTEKSAILLEKLQEIGHNQPFDSDLLPVHAALDDIPVYACDQGQAGILRQGQAVVVTNPKYFSGAVQQDGLIRAMIGERLVAIARLDDGYLVPMRIMSH